MIERPGRLMIMGYNGTEVPEEVFGFAKRWGLGGVILFARNVPDGGAVNGAVARFRRGLAEVDPGSPALVAVDQEGGRAERIGVPVPSLPSAAELGGGDPNRLVALVRRQAEALAGLGVDLNLAPVCDVIQPGESGAIGNRSFGADPARVSVRVAAHVGACRDGGVACCAKHFPGHGGARTDSHLALPSVRKTRAAWETVDAPPFRAAIGAGVPAIMAAHVLYPEVSASPATLCHGWLTRTLRDDLGFRGAVLSDDMEMGALGGLGSPGALAVRAVRAGCDGLIYGRMLDPSVSLDDVAAALSLEVPAERLKEAAGRVASLTGNRR